MKRSAWVMIPLAIVLAACSDAVEPLAPGSEADLTRGAVQPRAAAESPTVVEVALAVNAETGEFSTLIAAVLEAELADALSARGQRTVFAPTDAAFAALGLDAESVTTLPADQLTEILLYHVAPGRRDAGEVLESDRIRMANGGYTRIAVRGGAAYINESQIVQTDVEASNGIIHVIDAVLLP